MATVRELHRILGSFDRTPKSAGLLLRLDVAEVVLRELDRKGWSQKRLAEAAGMKESFISRVVHSDANCTLEVVGRVFTALGVKGSIVPARGRAASPAQVGLRDGVQSSSPREVRPKRSRRAA